MEIVARQKRLLFDIKRDVVVDEIRDLGNGSRPGLGQERNMPVAEGGFDAFESGQEKHLISHTAEVYSQKSFVVAHALILRSIDGDRRIISQGTAKIFRREIDQLASRFFSLRSSGRSGRLFYYSHS